MIVRALLLALVAASLVCFPSWASQPSGPAGKLIANPVVVLPPLDPNGLPQVTCAGFHKVQTFTPRQLDPADTVSLEMAIVPFRSGSTVVIVANLIQLAFTDGLVNGLPYRRSAWNDVKVLVRPATNDYLLTLNGVQAGPFANDAACGSTSNCNIEALAIRGDVFEETVAWIDSVSIVRNTASGPDIVLTDDFEGCYVAPTVVLGGQLIVEPPKNLNWGGAH